VENHHYVFTAVVGKSPSGGQSKMYALHARTLLLAKTAREREASITDLIEKLRSSHPSLEEFKANFIQMSYSSVNFHQKKLVRYTLGKFYRFGAKDTAVDLHQMTIEHLSPEARMRDKTEIVEVTESIGNLIFIPESINVRLGAKPWAQKRVELKKAKAFWVDEEVVKASSWGGKEIIARSEAMAEKAYRTIWRL
jgi:hypothetical protein